MRRDPSGNSLPVRLYHKYGRYWYVHRNQWMPLSQNYAEAMARYARIVSPGRGMPDLVDKVLEHIEAGGRLADNTLIQYRYAAGLIKDAFAEFDPAEVTQGHVAQFHDHLGATTPNMANRCLTVLRIIFDKACRWGLAPYNPASGVRRHEESKRTRYLNDAEFAAIRVKARPWVALLMDVLYLTGQRVGDVLALKRAAVTTEGIEFEQQKGGKRLRVAMTDELRDVLAAASRLHGNVLSPYVFHPRGKGTRYSYFTARDAYRLACEAAGVEDTTLHDIRAKALTDAEGEGLDATALAGHSSPAMTARYIRLRQMKTVAGPRFLRQSKDKTA